MRAPKEARQTEFGKLSPNGLVGLRSQQRNAGFSRPGFKSLPALEGTWSTVRKFLESSMIGSFREPEVRCCFDFLLAAILASVSLEPKYLRVGALVRTEALG